MARFNVIDLIILCIIIRCIYIGRKKGIIAELFKLSGVVFATFVTLHYYTRFGRFLDKILFPGRVCVYETISFIVLIWLVVVVFYLFREGWCIILKISTHSEVDKWGGIIFSLVRSYFLCSLVVLLLIVSCNRYVIKTTKQSLSGFFLKDTSINFYKSFYSVGISKIFPHEPINRKVINIYTRHKKRQRRK